MTDRVSAAERNVYGINFYSTCLFCDLNMDFISSNNKLSKTTLCGLQFFEIQISLPFEIFLFQ